MSLPGRAPPQDGPDRERRRFRANFPASSARTARMIAQTFRDRVASGVASATGAAGGAAGWFVSLAIGTPDTAPEFADSWGLGVSTEFEFAASRFNSPSVFIVSAALAARSSANARTREILAIRIMYMPKPYTTQAPDATQPFLCAAVMSGRIRTLPTPCPGLGVAFAAMGSRLNGGQGWPV